MLTFDYCLKANPAFLTTLKALVSACIDGMKEVDDMNLVPKIFVLERDPVPLTPIYLTTMPDVFVKGVDIWDIDSGYSFLDIHNMVDPNAAPVKVKEPELQYAKMEAYKAASGYWRVKVDGIVHPKLVGLDTEASACRRAYELFPYGHFLWPEEQRTKTMKSFGECEEANPNFVELVKALAQEAVDKGEDEDHYAYIFINGNHEIATPVPEYIVIKENHIPALYGNPHTLVSPYWTLNQILRMVTPRKEQP